MALGTVAVSVKLMEANNGLVIVCRGGFRDARRGPRQAGRAGGIVDRKDIVFRERVVHAQGGALTTSSSRGADGVECFDRGRAPLAA